jgi:hypothetical protein
MTTHANSAARSTSHPSKERLTAVEADAIVGGCVLLPRDQWRRWLKDNNPIKTVVKAANKAKDWIGDLFS